MKENEVKFPYPNLDSIVTKRKKRQRTSAVSETEEKDSRLQYERDYAEGFMKKLSERLDESTYIEVLNLLQNFETNFGNREELHNRVDSLLKSHGDLKWEFLAFLQPSQTLESGKLMEYLKISDMKEFVLKLMLHFKKQPHLLKKVIDKLCFLAENEHLQWDIIEENIASFLPKNSDLMQLFLRFFPSEKPLDKYFVRDDVWEEFNVDHDVIDEETFDASHLNVISHFEPKSCLYGCKNNASSTACIICDVKYINGRMYIANGRVLKPASLIFDPAAEKEHTKRLCGKNDYYVLSISKPPKVHKRADVCNKELNDGGLSPFILGTESEEEIGDTEVQQKSKKRKNTRSLKIRFKTKKKKAENLFPNDQAQTDDTAPSNDDGSCDDTSKEDNDYYSCDESSMKRTTNDFNSTLPAKEIISLEDMEFNISASTVTTNRTGEVNRATPDIQKHVRNYRTNLI